MNQPTNDNLEHTVKNKEARSPITFSGVPIAEIANPSKIVDIDKSLDGTWTVFTDEGALIPDTPYEIGDIINGVEEWQYSYANEEDAVNETNSTGVHYYSDVDHFASRELEDALFGTWELSSTCPQQRKYKVIAISANNDCPDKQDVCEVLHPYTWVLSVEVVEQKNKAR